MQEEQQCNPARRRLQAPFLKRPDRPRPHLCPSPDRLPVKKQPFCRAAIAVKQSGRKAVESTPPASSRPAQEEAEWVERELLRKKSELLSLNLKCLEMQEKYAVLLERSKRSGCEWEFDELSSTEDPRSLSDQRTERLASIKARLSRLDFTNCCRMASGGK